MTESKAMEPEPPDPPLNMKYNLNTPETINHMNNQLTAVLNEQRDTIRSLYSTVDYPERESKRTARQPPLSPTYYNISTFLEKVAILTTKVA